jgi:hypothetical protein
MKLLYLALILACTGSQRSNGEQPTLSSPSCSQIARRLQFADDQPAMDRSHTIKRTHSLWSTHTCRRSSDRLRPSRNMDLVYAGNALLCDRSLDEYTLLTGRL